MPQARSGDTVKIHYTGRLKDGTVFDASGGQEPLQLVIGGGATLLKLEEGIIGMEAGQKRSLEIPARDAFGPRRRNLERVLRPDLMPTGQKVEVGQKLRIQQENGTHTVVTVINVTREGEVMVDTNHPLAGEDLVFEIELVEISPGNRRDGV